MKEWGDGMIHDHIQVRRIAPNLGAEIAGVDPGESDALLDKLYRHAQRLEFGIRIVWRPNTLAVWESSRYLHYPVADYFPRERKLPGAAIKGEAIAAA